MGAGHMSIIGRGKSGIPLGIAAQVPFPVTLDDRFQNVAPAVGAMNIAGAQRTPLKVTERVEQEQRMLTGAAEMTIVSRSLLFAMGRTDVAVHVENDHLRWTAVMNTVDPCPAHVVQGFNVCISRQKLCLKTPHLAGGRSLSFDGLATNNPPHGGITTETVGVVHLLISTKAAKHQTDGTVRPCRAIRSSRYGCLGKYPRQPG